MKKLFFIIGLSFGAYALGSAQTITSASGTAPKAACCQKGGEAKACCAKDTKTASATPCTGHDHKSEKAEAAPATNGSDKKAKEKGKAVKTSSL